MRTTGRAHLRVFPIAILLSACASQPGTAPEPIALSPELRQVRAALDKYKDPVVAVHDGYWSTLGCVTFPKAGGPGRVPYPPGGMGVHFVNMALLKQGVVDPLKPQILVYEPVGDRLELVAAEWLIPLSPQVKERPRLFGQPFDGPMEGHHPLMPTALHHYDLHAWLWKPNPAGMYAPTNINVTCPKARYTLEEEAPRTVPHR